MFAAPVCSCLVWGSGGYINFDRPARGKLSPSHFLVSLDVFKIYTSLLMCVSLPLLQNISEFSKPPYYHRMCFSLPLCSKISQSSQNAFSVILCLSVLFRVCSNTSNIVVDEKHVSLPLFRKSAQILPKRQCELIMSRCFSFESLLKYFQKYYVKLPMSLCFCFFQKPAQIHLKCPTTLG